MTHFYSLSSLVYLESLMANKKEPRHRYNSKERDMMAKRTSKTITDPKEVNFLLNITEEEGQKLSFIMDNFCPFKGKPPRFNPYDIFIVPAGAYGPEGKKNKQQFTTTVGRWVYNKVFIEQDLFDLFHYVNETLNKKMFNKINVIMSHALIEDKITLDVLKKYVLKTQKFQPYCNVLCPSITEEVMMIPSQIKKKKAELFKKYEKELKENDPVTSQKIEKELLAEASKYMKDDDFMDLVNSGARLTWGNNFKNTFVFRGAVKESDPAKGGYTIIKSNFADGMSPEDYTDFANSLTGGPYARAKKTEVGGAWEKMFVRAFQHLRVLPEGTDCGTKKHLTITLTEDNIGDWMYSYVIEGNNLVEITSDNMDKYIGKTVKLRYSGLCESKEGICSKCAGHLFNRIGLNEVGLASYQICSVIKNISMKAFHDGTVKVTNIEKKYGLNKIFGTK